MRSRAQAVGVAGIFACLLAVRSFAHEVDAMDAALAALQRSDYSSAEQILKEHLHLHPNDVPALGVLGVVLDQQKRYVEADEVYHQALASSAPDPALLNNFGNHLVATGKPAEARKTFLQVIGIDAGNANALVQLARMALEANEPGQALGYLRRIPQAARVRRDAEMLTMQAEYVAGNQRRGDTVLADLALAAQTDPAQSFALGVALASAKQYDKAETFFSLTLKARPADFDVLYDLGLAASHAGHNERARSVLQEALAQQPENVDVLYDLAVVNVELDAREPALELLAQAARRAPERADIVQLEARTSEALGYFGDAERAWDRYLELVPGDDAARRERAFAQTAIGDRTAEGLTELSAFVRKHPNDALGRYELGTAETPGQPADALKELNRALALKPGLDSAHVARGLLLYREGKLDQALSDFQFVTQKEPNNGIILDRLGETYMTLDRTSEALPVLRKAAELLPLNSTVLLHLGRALSKSGQQDEASSVFARCRELGPNRAAAPHPAGLVEFLGLSPEEQKAKFRAGVERTVQTNPDNVEAQVRHLGILLEDGRMSDAAAVVRILTSHQLSLSLMTDAARMLLAAKQYTLVLQLLNPVQVSLLEASAPLELKLDLALADLTVLGPQAGLDMLNRVPQPQRKGDYELALAQMLQAQKRPEEARHAIAEGLRALPTRSDLLCQATLLLIEDQHFREAAELLVQAEQIVPNDPDLLLLQAVNSELVGRAGNSDAAFKELETHWAGWYKVWLSHSFVLAVRGQEEQARAMRDAALALDAPVDLLNLGRQHPFTATELATAIKAVFDEA